MQNRNGQMKSRITLQDLYHSWAGDARIDSTSTIWSNKSAVSSDIRCTDVTHGIQQQITMEMLDISDASISGLSYIDKIQFCETGYAQCSSYGAEIHVYRSCICLRFMRTQWIVQLFSVQYGSLCLPNVLIEGRHQCAMTSSRIRRKLYWTVHFKRTQKRDSDVIR